MNVPALLDRAFSRLTRISEDVSIPANRGAIEPREGLCARGRALRFKRFIKRIEDRMEADPTCPDKEALPKKKDCETFAQLLATQRVRYLFSDSMRCPSNEVRYLPASLRFQYTIFRWSQADSLHLQRERD